MTKPIVQNKYGFTIIELVVVILIMCILAGVGLIGFGGLVDRFTGRTCNADRKQAAQSYISQWLQDDIVVDSANAQAWLTDVYSLQKEGYDKAKWAIQITEESDGNYTVKITCSRHADAEDAVEIPFHKPHIKVPS